MNDDLKNLDKPAMLLMYLAGELSDGDRARVERMLGEDAELRQELQSLREAQESGTSALAALDGVGHPMPEAVALRRVSRMMRQYALQRQAPPPPLAIVRKPIPWLRYSSAAAAILLVGFSIWSVYHQGSDRRGRRNPNQYPISSEDRLALLVATWDISDLEDAQDLQAATPPRLEDLDFSDDIVNLNNIR